MKKTAIILILTLSGCSLRTTVEREINPVERFDTTVEDGRSEIKTLMADISLRYISPKEGEELSKSEIYSANGDYLLDEGEIFSATIKNTSERRITDCTFEIAYGDTKESSTTEETIAKNFTLSDTAMLNYQELLKPRRIFGEGRELNISESTLYDFDFITPSDTIHRFLLFRKIPSDIDKFKIIVSFRSGALKKVIDFDFTRNEYRSKGSFSKRGNNVNNR